MKKWLFLFPLVATALVLGACNPASAAVFTTASPVPPDPTPTGPALLSNTDLVLAMVDNLNAGSVEESLAYFADTAVVYLIGFPPTGIEIYNGKEEIRKLWEDSAANHFRWEVDITSAVGNEVHVRAETWHDFTQALGVAPLVYTDVYEFQNGKIVTYISWLTQESLSRFKPAFAEAVPPETPAPIAEELAVSELTVTISDGTCTTDTPLVLKAGRVTFQLNTQDPTNDLYAFTIFNIDESRDILDLMVSTAGYPPGWATFLLSTELGPGKTRTETIKIEQGPVYLICWSKPPDTPIGNIEFQVVP